jgi:hypothetical protein
MSDSIACYHNENVAGAPSTLYKATMMAANSNRRKRPSNVSDV